MSSMLHPHFQIVLRRLGIASIVMLLSCSDSQQLSPNPSELELDDQAPTCPGLSSVTVSAGPSLSLVWAQAADNVTQASGISYRIYMKRSTENYDLLSPVKILQGATSTLVTTNVVIGNTYTLFVACVDEKGNQYPTGPENELSIAVSDSLPPAQITALEAGNASFTSILLTWPPSDDGVGGTTASNMRYSVYGSTTASVSTAGSPLTTVTGVTSFLHTGLNPNTTWHYRVVALDALDNRSPDSNEASATTVADISPPAFASGDPTITANTTGSSTIGLSWTAATDNVTPQNELLYRLYRCSGNTACNPFTGTLVTTTSGGGLAYTDTGLTASTTYVYGVRVVDSTGNESVNTGTKVAYTQFASSGSFYALPFNDDVNTRQGSAVAVANVIGDATGANAFPDLIVGVPNASEPGTSYRLTGCVLVYAGTAVGQFSASATYQFCAPNAGANGTDGGQNFGTAIAVGDLDVDGIDDIVVSDPLRSRVYIYRTINNSGTLSVGTTATAIVGPNNTFGAGLCLGDSDSVAGSGLDIFAITPSETCNPACGGTTGTGNVLVFNNASTAGTFIAPSNIRVCPHLTV